MHGGHGFKVLKTAQMIEVKQGPYISIKDKEKFESISDKQVIIKFKIETPPQREIVIFDGTSLDDLKYILHKKKIFCFRK